MAKHTDIFHTMDQINAIESALSAGTILKVIGESGSGKKEVLVERIINGLNMKQIEEENILLLTTSKESISEIRNRFLEKGEGEKFDNIKTNTFQSLIEEFLSIHYPNWKILKETRIKKIQNDLLKNNNAEISYNKLKNSIQQISAVSTTKLKSMNKSETLIRYGLNNEGCLSLKKLVGDFLFIPYSQIIEESFKFPELINMLKEFKFINIYSFHNLREDECELLIKLSKNKHITLISNDESISKSNQFKKNWNLISENYSKAKITEIKLSRVKDNGVEIVDNCSINEALKAVLTFNKIDTNNAYDITTAIFKVFNNPNLNVPLLQLLTVIPGIDEKFIIRFIDIVSKENKSSVFEFINKYQDSFTDKTKLKLLPVVKYLNSIDKNLDKTNGNSIVIHLMNFAKILGIKIYGNEKMKNDFIDIHTWFYKLPSNIKGIENLLEHFIKKKSSKLPNIQKPVVSSSPKPQTITKSPTSTSSKISGTFGNLNIVFNVNSKTGSIKTEQTAEAPIIKRSGSIKYKPRPRSWHAGNIFNTVRKLR